MFCTSVVEKEFRPVALFQVDDGGRRLQLQTFDTVEAAVDMIFYRPRTFFFIEADADNADCFDVMTFGPGGAVQFAIEPTKY